MSILLSVYCLEGITANVEVLRIYYWNSPTDKILQKLNIKMRVIIINNLKTRRPIANYPEFVINPFSKI